ncbi:GerAB/ArcD/ProY family transporter [Paenibacillus sp. CAU 1782]
MDIRRQTVSSFQMSVLFFVFMTGSSIIFVPGPLIERAGNSAWISLLLSGAVGFGILGMLLFLNRRFPSMTYVDISRKMVGSTVTLIFGLLTMSYLFHMQAAIVVGVGQFMISSMLRETPLYAFTFLIFLISSLTARAGIEVMARMFMLIMVTTTVSVVIVLTLAIPDYHPAMLMPLMPKGVTPIFYGAYYTFGFPFVEIFLFGMLLPYTARKKRGLLSKHMVVSLGISIILLCVVTLCSIMVFGAYAAENPYLLFSIARLVEFQEIIQRIESIIGMALILGSYMKTTITLFVLSLFIAKLFRLKDASVLVMPVALSGFLLGLVTYDSATQWIGVITAVHPLWTGLVLFCPLLVVTLTAAIRQPSVQGAGSETEEVGQGDSSDSDSANDEGSAEGKSQDDGGEDSGDVRENSGNANDAAEKSGDTRITETPKRTDAASSGQKQSGSGHGSDNGSN